MEREPVKRDTLENSKINVKIKLAGLWTSLMFLYLYVDFFHLYMPGTLQNLLAGKVFVLNITPSFVLSALCAMMVPTLMIFLSLAVPAAPNRWLNLILASLYIPFTLFNLAGETWPHMLVAALVEVLLLTLIIRYSWTWPRE